MVWEEGLIIQENLGSKLGFQVAVRHIQVVGGRILHIICLLIKHLNI